jgi:chromosome segregation ATPase
MALFGLADIQGRRYSMTERLSEERLAELTAALPTLLDEVRELRQQSAVYERELSRWQTRAEQSEFAATKNRKWAEICERQLADLLAERERIEAQVAVMDGRLRSLVDTADCEQCIAKSPIGCAGEACSITHIKRMVESVPNVAKILLAEREKMRAALEWYAEDGRYMRTRWTDYGAGTFSEAEVIIDHGQRAREALRKEDTATDA